MRQSVLRLFIAFIVLIALAIGGGYALPVGIVQVNGGSNQAFIVSFPHNILYDGIIPTHTDSSPPGENAPPEPQLIGFDNVQTLYWSTDQKWVAFVARLPEDVYLVDVTEENPTPQKLTEGVAGLYGFHGLQWSPVEPRLLFIYDLETQRNVFLADALTGEVTQLTDFERQVGETRAAWSPDGKRIAAMTHLTRIPATCQLLIFKTTGGNPLHDISFQGGCTQFTRINWIMLP